jgi:pimeloyl-ACP methyl ester carboxylesterase
MTNHHQSSTGLDAQGVIQSLKLKVGEHEIHYLEAGNGSPVVLVHGGASDCRDWVETMAALSHSYGVYAPDLPGYGLSSRDESGYYLSDFVEFIIEFIQTLGLNSAVLVGHSLGGRACLEVALRHPEMVRRLVLIDTAGFGKLTRWGMFLGATAWAVRNILRRSQPYPKFLWKDGEDRDWFCLEELPALHVPTLMVWSRHDPYHPVGGALRARELIPESYLEVLPGYGHAPHVRKRDLFNNLLLNFIERQ